MRRGAQGEARAERCSQAVRCEQAVRYMHVHMRTHARNVQWKPGACRHAVVRGVRGARGARWLMGGRRRRAGTKRAVARGGAEQRGQACLPPWSDGAEGRTVRHRARGRPAAGWMHGAMHGWCACAGAGRTPAEASHSSSPRASPSSLARRTESMSEGGGGARAGPTLTGHVPGRGGIGPNSSRAALRLSSSALGPDFKVYAAVSSAMAAGAA